MATNLTVVTATVKNFTFYDSFIPQPIQVIHEHFEANPEASDFEGLINEIEQEMNQEAAENQKVKKNGGGFSGFLKTIYEFGKKCIVSAMARSKAYLEEDLF